VSFPQQSLACSRIRTSRCEATTLTKRYIFGIESAGLLSFSEGVGSFSTELVGRRSRLGTFYAKYALISLIAVWTYRSRCWVTFLGVTVCC